VSIETNKKPSKKGVLNTILTNNSLTKYFEKLYENEATSDTSKVSGKDLRKKELSAQDISYLKSITDGAKSFGDPSNKQTEIWS
jgi:hypothetical protein